MAVRVAFDGAVRRGRAIDLSALSLDPETVVAAVRDAEDARVECPAPGAVHAAVGHVTPDCAVSLTAALAAAARSRGHLAPQRDDVDALASRLNDASPPPPPSDLDAKRRRAAETGADVRRLDERVATLRGRVQTLRDLDAPSDRVAAAEAELADAIRELSEVETERVAAEQALRRAERAARESRDARARRLRLQDRHDNLVRAARAHLATAVYDEFAEAVRTLPGRAAPGDAPAEFEGDPATAAFGVLRVADVDAPAVLTTRRFGSANEAATRLGVPVLRL